QHMPFASVEFLARIVAALLAAFGALDALAVDDPSGGRTLASFHLAQVFPQMRVNLFPQMVAFPESEVMIDGAPGRKVLGQVPPLAGGAHDIEHRVEQLPIGVLARASRLGGFGKTIMDELPFGLRQVMSVSH